MHMTVNQAQSRVSVTILAIHTDMQTAIDSFTPVG